MDKSGDLLLGTKMLKQLYIASRLQLNVVPADQPSYTGGWWVIIAIMNVLYLLAHSPHRTRGIQSSPGD